MKKILILTILLILTAPVYAAEINNFGMTMVLEKEKVNFNFEGELIGHPTEPDIFRIEQAGYVEPVRCQIANQNCKIDPVPLIITVGPTQTLQPNGTIVTTDNRVTTQINSPAYINVPADTQGYFNVNFNILDLIKTERAAHNNFLDLDQQESYKVDSFVEFQTTMPTKINYFSITAPENFILYANSKFCYFTLCGTSDCSSCYNFKDLKSKYTLENVSYSDKPYIMGLTIPAYDLIRFELYFGRSKKFIYSYWAIAILLPFLIFVSYLVKTKITGLSAELVGWAASVAPFILLRANYLKLDPLPIRAQDIAFMAIFILLAVVELFMRKRIVTTTPHKLT